MVMVVHGMPEGGPTSLALRVAGFCASTAPPTWYLCESCTAARLGYPKLQAGAAGILRLQHRTGLQAAFLVTCGGEVDACCVVLPRRSGCEVVDTS